MTIGTTTAQLDERPAAVLRMWPRSFRTVTRARHLPSEHLDAWSLSHLADAAESVVSELVSNAINHARTPRGHLIATRFERLESGVRIEVHDASERTPERQEASVDAEFGRGLALVDALTSGQWGVSVRHGPGKMVWAVCADDEKIGTPR